MTFIAGNEGLKITFKSILFCMVFVAILMLVSQFKNLIPREFERFTYGIIGTGVAFFTTWLFLRFDKRSFADIGLKWESKTIKRFFTGSLTGLFISATMILGLVAFTNLELNIQGEYSVLTFFTWTLALIPLAFMEELAFRAYPFIHLQEATGIRIAQIIIAILFALYHFVGGQSLFSSFIGPGVWSFVFGLAMIMSGGISFPTGLHYGANLFLAAVGQHKQFESIWVIRYEKGTNPETMNLDLAGNLIQFILFIATIAVMEWWLRRKNKPII